MRIHKKFFKCIPLTALLFTGFAAGGIAQDTSTIVNPETEAPVIITTTPSDGEVNVDPGSVIEITFSSEMDETTINGTTLMLHSTSDDSMQEVVHGEMLDEDQMLNEDQMMDEDQINDRSADAENNRQNTKEAVNGTISYSNKVAVFTPDMELKEDAVYTFTVTNGVKSSENIALENDHNWSFTTTGTSDQTFSDKQNVKEGMDSKEYSESTMNGNEYSESATDSNGYSENAMNGNEYSESTMDSTLKGEKNMIDLGKAGQFVILAKTKINNETQSNISGHVGEGSVADSIKKENEDSDSARQTTSDHDQAEELQSNQSDDTSPDVSEAIEDMMSAFSDASMQNRDVESRQNGDDEARQNRDDEARRQNGDDEARRQNGDDEARQKNERFDDKVLTSGVHEWSDSLHLDSDITLSGSADDVWLFKVSGNLVIDENIVFTLSDGARADNVFWYVEGEVTIGENAQFEGIILSTNEITLGKGAKHNGRMFSQSSITLDGNTVTEPESMAGRTSSTNR